MKLKLVWLLGLVLLFVWNDISAHPGSGIVVDRQGNVYFVDTGSGVYKIDKTGKLTKLSAPAYHWMAIDVDNRLAGVTLPHFSPDDATITRTGSNPALLLSSDFPITVGHDGSLYYPWPNDADEVQIFRLAPSEKSTVVKTLPPVRSNSGDLRWRNGIVASSDGSIYYSEDRAIRKINLKGEVLTVADNLQLPKCQSVPGMEPEHVPYCRGLDVDSAGNVFVAVTGCAQVIKISPEGSVTTVLQSSPPWSPTAVAVSDRDLYVLEYLHTPNDNRREWLPRVRTVSPDGSVTTVASIDRR